MMLSMAVAAQPNNFERFLVIIMVHLSFSFPTNRTRVSAKIAAN